MVVRNLELTDYKSVQNWLITNGKKRYKLPTEKANLECLDFWCSRLNKNPDELIPSNLKEAQRNQEKIMGHLLIEGKGTANRILQHTTKYHAFCECNGFPFPLGGDELRKVLRSIRVSPDDVKELLDFFRLLKERKTES